MQTETETRETDRRNERQVMWSSGYGTGYGVEKASGLVPAVSLSQLVFQCGN